MNLRMLGPASLNAQLLGFKIAGIAGTSAPGKVRMWGCIGDSWVHELIYSQLQQLPEDGPRASSFLFSFYKNGSNETCLIELL